MRVAELIELLKTCDPTAIVEVVSREPSHNGPHYQDYYMVELTSELIEFVDLTNNPFVKENHPGYLKKFLQFGIC